MRHKRLLNNPYILLVSSVLIFLFALLFYQNKLIERELNFQNFLLKEKTKFAELDSNRVRLIFSRRELVEVLSILKWIEFDRRNLLLELNNIEEEFLRQGKVSQVELVGSGWRIRGSEFERATASNICVRINKKNGDCQLKPKGSNSFEFKVFFPREEE